MLLDPQTIAQILVQELYDNKVLPQMPSKEIAYDQLVNRIARVLDDYAQYCAAARLIDEPTMVTGNGTVH